MPIEIEFADARWKKVRGLKAAILKAHAATLSKRDAARITTLLLTRDKAMCALNNDWRGKDMPTNVLSFPAGDMKLPRGSVRPLGDVALGHETCAREAREQAKSLKDHALHLIVHGLLHLTGHDHIVEAQAAKMEAREISILRKLGIANPYVLNDKS